MSTKVNNIKNNLNKECSFKEIQGMGEQMMHMLHGDLSQEDRFEVVQLSSSIDQKLSQLEKEEQALGKKLKKLRQEAEDLYEKMGEKSPSENEEALQALYEKAKGFQEKILKGSHFLEELFEKCLKEIRKAAFSLDFWVVGEWSFHAREKNFVQRLKELQKAFSEGLEKAPLLWMQLGPLSKKGIEKGFEEIFQKAFFLGDSEEKGYSVWMFLEETKALLSLGEEYFYGVKEKALYAFQKLPFSIKEAVLEKGEKDDSIGEKAIKYLEDLVWS